MSNLRDEFQLGPEPERSRREEADAFRLPNTDERTLACHFEPVKADYAEQEFMYFTVRDVLIAGGVPFVRANHFALKVVEAFQKKP